MNKKKAKNAKCGKKLRIQKPESEKIYEIGWKIHEGARGKSPLS